MTYRAEYANAGSPEYPWAVFNDEDTPGNEMVGPCMTETEAKEIAAGVNLIRSLKRIVANGHPVAPLVIPRVIEDALKAAS